MTHKSERAGPKAQAGPEIQLVRSPRRRRTYKWSLVDGMVRLEVPTGLKASDEARIVAEVAERARDEELLARARALARRHVPRALSRLRSVGWSDRQERRWGSCSADTGAIRLSGRLHGLPDYVLEAVLVHELAHLLEPNHTARAWKRAEWFGSSRWASSW